MTTEGPTLRITGFLVVSADGRLRTVKQRPRLMMDEVAFPLSVTIPRTWGRVQAARIELTMPEPPEALIAAGEPETAEVPKVEE